MVGTAVMRGSSSATRMAKIAVYCALFCVILTISTGQKTAAPTTTKTTPTTTPTTTKTTRTTTKTTPTTTPTTTTKTTPTTTPTTIKTTPTTKPKTTPTITPTTTKTTPTTTPTTTKTRPTTTPSTTKTSPTTTPTTTKTTPITTSTSKPATTTTTKALNASFISNLRTKIRNLINTDAVERGNPNVLAMLGGLARLSFHDCVGRCDGCINNNLPDNAGLSIYIDRIEKFYVDENLGGVISHADLWALAGSEAIIYSTYLDNACQACPNVTVPLIFKWGRQDCPTPPYDNQVFIFPSASGNTSHVFNFFKTQFNFTERETVAILGAHTLGRAHRNASGFNHKWVSRDGRFNNAYYQDLINTTMGWHMADEGDPKKGARWQWNNNDSLIIRQMMLNADMALIKNITGIDSEGKVTGCVYSTCQDLPTRQYAVEFAANNQQWINEFAAAFTKMINFGYTNLKDVSP